ncbi:hypothetical protein KZZ52_01315 [Dactylosporangium sp. AC04546]|uniref:hypothetical protein n=1 Tax=Dactylosporangium sp. AC04546 TaxID=2862460 RepID=UPI001EE11206|nr:hypothetical protein [Dactylosporangium sp. AC04546]WVK84109.1 hypothetical protein KZZ52_01315 [Dactylosporangium sp. AC04546]
MAALLALLPLATLLSAAVVLRPRDEETPQRHRLAIIRAALAVGAGAVLSVELLSLAGAVARGPVIALWAIAAVVTGYLAWRRRPADWQAPWPPLYLAIPVALLVLAELVLALASAPNNFDSNSYHLPKIEHWIANGDLGNYATFQIQQLILVPGAEFLLLHLRLLTGDDGLFNLLQWGAGLLGAVALSRCAAQLGAGRIGQWLAAAVFLTAPAVVLESTSTQNDLVVVAWVTCAATIALNKSPRISDALALAAAAGLVTVTKSTGLMALAPVLIFWGIAQLRQKAIKATLSVAGLVIAAMLLLAGPSFLRVHDAFGSPLGPEDYRVGLSTQRHDPPAILVNGLRLGASTLLTPVPAVNEAVGKAVIGVAHLVDVDPNDPAITQWKSVFPGTRWKPDEDRSPYPIQSALVLLGLAVGLFVPRTRWYAAMVLGAFLLTAAVVKWQDWGNRLILPAFALAVPLAGVWLERISKRKIVAAGVALVMAAAFAHAAAAVLLGQPRRLIGQGSVFTVDDWQERFARMPAQAASYRTAIDEVRASGARRVGLVVEGDLWEYPVQIELRDTELVSLLTGTPAVPAASVFSVDAVICFSSADLCRRAVPADWRYRQIDPLVATAFPPA